MAGENYTVQYNIKVNDNGAAKVLQSFTTATANLTKAEGNLDLFAKKINEITGQLNNMARKSPTLKINTGTVNRQLDNIIRKLERIQALSKQRLTLSATTVAGGRGGRGTTTGVGVGGGKPQSAPAPMGGGTSSAKPKVIPATPKRTSSGGGRGGTRYQALGQTLIDTGGVGVLDFAKGMGIAYGIAGLGSLMGNVVRDSAEYNNIIQTTRNILGTHDKAPNFGGRFKEMERIVRQVGIETKFTAPQVADASKFLAMAGFDLDAINKSIRPIADIALVGDNDLGQTADVVTNIMTGYGISPERVRQAADVMTMTFTKSNTTLMEIAESYKYAASLLALNGTSFEEATAAIGILGDAGIKGSQAGTTMRTMALNIAKPTKAQREMWEKLGISRTDANGNIRPLIDIFQDLNARNLTLTQFGSLFHKTATQGAASLAAHVDKWNEMIRLNFLSDGVTAKLAEEKKNTIQGLWYQLTSSFTEAGMQAFEAQESPIREIMNKVIAWLKTPDAIDKIKRLSNAIMEIGKTLMGFSKILMRLYEQFEGIILFWLKAQLYLKGTLIPLRVISAVRNFAAYMFNAARSIALTTTNMGALNTQFLRVQATALGRGYSSATAQRWMGMYGQNTGTPLMMMGRGIASIAGGIGGAMLGSMVGEEGSAASAFGSVSGGILGMMYGPKLLSLFGRLLTTTTGGIIGFGAAAAGAVYGIYKYYASVEQAGEAVNAFYRSTQSLNGINMSEYATMADKYMSIVYNKQLDANTALAEYINLRKEELGLLKDLNGEAGQESGEATKNIARYSAPLKDLMTKFGVATIARHWNQALSNEGVDAGLAMTELFGTGAWGRPYSIGYRFNGVDYTMNAMGSQDAKTVLDAAAAARFLYAMGRDTGKGTAARSIIDNFQTNYLQAKTVEDYNAVSANFASTLSQLQGTIIPGSEYWSLDTIGNNPLSTNQRGYHYVMAEIEAIRNAFQPDDRIALWKQILGLSDNGEEIPQSLLQAFLVKSGVDIMDSSKYGTFGSPEWLSKFGWSEGAWHAITYTDAQGQQINLTADQARSAYLKFHEQILDIVRQVNPKLQGYFNSFINDDIWHPEAQTGLTKGKTQTLDGVTYTWDGNAWVPPSPTGLPSLSNAQMNARLGAGANPTTTPTVPGTTGGNGGYTNQYKSTSATPKQIIVKIENLMNVESVDMSDPNVAATVNNLKEQMAQALIDVVADFDANASNLT